MAWVNEERNCADVEGFSIRQSLPPCWTVRHMAEDFTRSPGAGDPTEEHTEDAAGATPFSRQEFGFCYRRMSQGSADSKYSPRYNSARSNCNHYACSMRLKDLESQICSLSDMNDGLKSTLRREQQNIEGLSKALQRSNEEMRAISEICTQSLREKVKEMGLDRIVFEHLNHCSSYSYHSIHLIDCIEPGLQPLRQAQQICAVADNLRNDLDTAFKTILDLETQLSTLSEEAISRKRDIDSIKEIETRNFSLNQEVESLRFMCNHIPLPVPAFHSPCFEPENQPSQSPQHLRLRCAGSRCSRPPLPWRRSTPSWSPKRPLQSPSRSRTPRSRARPSIASGEPTLSAGSFRVPPLSQVDLSVLRSPFLPTAIHRFPLIPPARAAGAPQVRLAFRRPGRRWRRRRQQRRPARDGARAARPGALPPGRGRSRPVR